MSCSYIFVGCGYLLAAGRHGPTRLLETLLQCMRIPTRSATVTSFLCVFPLL